MIQGNPPLPATIEEKIRRYFPVAVLVLLVLLCLVRFHRLTWDFPPGIAIDGVLLNDEGFYTSNALTWNLEGKWLIEKEFNQIINTPAYMVIQATFFKVFGVSLLTARLVHMMFVLGLLACVYALVRRYHGHNFGLVAAGLLCVSHFFHPFSRLAIAEIPMMFFIVLSFALGAYSAGKNRYWFAAAAAVVYTIALMTKPNALFAAPVLGLIIVMQELDWRKIIVKFALCSGIFFLLMGLYYLALVRPHKEDFFYFFELNIGVAGSTGLVPMLGNLWAIVAETAWPEPVLTWAFLVFFPLMMAASPSYRRDPLVYATLAWFVLYILMFAGYGRFMPRFYLALLPAMAIWAAVTLRHAAAMHPRHWAIVYTFATILAASSLVHLVCIGKYLSHQENTYNAMAADVREILDADPEFNGILMGHFSHSMALRIGTYPRHDRYSRHPLPERLALYRPQYYISEGEIRGYPLGHYYRHREWIERDYRVEYIRRWDNVLSGYRGYPLVLYRLHPRGAHVQDTVPHTAEVTE